MILPIQITYRHIDHTEEAEQCIREEAAKLDKYFPRIMSCRVLLEMPHRHRAMGNPFQLRIDLGVPGRAIAVKHPTVQSVARRPGAGRKSKQAEVESPPKDLHGTIREAFKSAKRQLQDYAREIRRDVKTHAPLPRAVVARLVPEEDCGFLATLDGREIYFHRKSVLNDAYRRLCVGDQVIFAEEQGEKGPQASTVKLAARHLAPTRERKQSGA